MDGAFRRLKPRDRSLLWLAYVEQMTHAEIAVVLEVKTGSVKVLLSRARSRFADILKSLGLAPEVSP